MVILRAVNLEVNKLLLIDVYVILAAVPSEALWKILQDIDDFALLELEGLYVERRTRPRK